MRSSIIRVRQYEQRRRSISVKDCGDEGTMLPLYWAGALPIALSPITAYSDGDEASLARYANAGLVNIDHYLKFDSASTGDTEAVYARLSPMDADTRGDETSMHLEGPQSLVNIAHIGKVKRRRAKSLQRTYENISTIVGTSYRLTLFAPCLQKGRKTQ
jgi:hypothetical protein